jgi:hypothetical protein
MPVTTYTATARVEAYNSKRKYTTSSKPTLTQVSYIIADVFADMNQRMSAVGISVPVSTSPATSASGFLKMVHSIGAAAFIEESAFMGGNKQESDHVNGLMKKYEQYMKSIETNPSIISNSMASFNSLEYSDVDEQRDSEPFERSVNKW